jgi:outer membrane protein
VNGNHYNYLNSIDTNPLGRTVQSSSTRSPGLELRLPLFQGGRPAAQVRQAQARRSQAMEQVIEAERIVIAQVRSAWAVWRSSQDVITSSQRGSPPTRSP